MYKSDDLMKMAKRTVGLGVLTGVGMYGVGQLGRLAGPASAPAVRATGTALNLVAVGNLASIGMSLMPEVKKKKSSSKEVNRILGL